MMLVTLAARPHLAEIEHTLDVGLVHPPGHRVNGLSRRHVEDGPRDARHGVAVPHHDVI